MILYIPISLKLILIFNYNLSIYLSIYLYKYLYILYIIYTIYILYIYIYIYCINIFYVHNYEKPCHFLNNCPIVYIFFYSFLINKISTWKNLQAIWTRFVEVKEEGPKKFQTAKTMDQFAKISSLRSAKSL